ncbi:MAG: hypothetical protein V1793_12560 [Pseudomonadota bacterium]
MLRNDLVLKSPAMIIMGKENLHQGRFGAVMSRAGVGKTQFLVQIALTWLLEGEHVLHISLNDQMDKINIRYKDGYTNLIDSIGYVDPQKANRLWEDILPCKTGLCYSESTFKPEKIRDYLKSFKKEDLRVPAVIIIDGLDFDSDLSPVLDELRTISREFAIPIWFSMKTHREEPVCDDGFPPQLERVKDMFDKALALQPQADRIEAVILKDGARANQKYLLDPSTMMLA